jgi:DnaJ-class molecular chaperone
MSDRKQKAETTTEPAIVGNTVLAAVPYQCCPVCNGNGKTVTDGFTSSVYQTCKVCNGAMIIPMHIVDWRFTVKT